MEAIIISKEIVKPSTPTPPHLRIHKQSFLDQFTIQACFNVTLFYKTPFASTQLKNALSDTLTRFYPLAGELKHGSGIVDCNDNGVLYVEVHVYGRLHEFLDTPDLSKLREFIPRSTSFGLLEYVENLETLVSIQVTEFDCGGVAIGVVMYHKVLDASTMSDFLNTWAKIAREQRVDSVETRKMILDFTTPALLFPARNPLPENMSTLCNSLSFDEGVSVMRRFMFDAKAIAAIKVKSSSESVPNPTRVEALTGFLWKHMLLANRAVKGSSSPCMLTHVVNLRPRLDPPLPNAFGNLLWLAIAFHEPDMSEIELSHLVEMVREMFDSLKGDNLKVLEGDGAFNYIKDLATDAGTTFDEVDTYRFTSWCRFGLYDVDFGWGKPVWIAPLVEPVGSLNNQITVLVENGLNDGIEAWIIRYNEEMVQLENDEEFLAYASPNPSVYVS